MTSRIEIRREKTRCLEAMEQGRRDKVRERAEEWVLVEAAQAAELAAAAEVAEAALLRVQEAIAFAPAAGRPRRTS